jgi:hypothetical protein
MTMSLDDYSKRVLDPAMSALAAKVEADCIERATKKIFNQVGTAGTVPNTLVTYLEAREKLNQFLAPKDKRRNILIPSRFSTKIVDALKALAQDDGEIARQYREGEMSRAVGFTWAESESMYTHTNGTQTMTGTVKTTVASSGSSTLVVAGAGATKTIKAGTVFTIAGVYAVHPETKAVRATLQQFVVTADVSSDGSGDATLTVSPAMHFSATGQQNISAAPTATAVTTFVGTPSQATEQGLAYHEDAFTFATADLELPKGGATASRAVYDGISMRIAHGFDITNDKHPTRVDILYGFDALRGSHACRITA